MTPGLASVATAVLDHSEHPVAAVALTFPETTSDRSELAAHVQRAAKQVSERIHGVTSP